MAFLVIICVLLIGCKNKGIKDLKEAIDTGHASYLTNACKCGKLSGDDKIKYPLHYAVEQGNLVSVHLLAKLGLDVDELDDQLFTPLMKAVQFSYGEIVKKLLDKGADLQKRGWQNHTALTYAVHNKNAHMVQVLLEQGANPNMKIDEVTLLIYAVVESSSAVVKKLLEGGANVDTTDRVGSTPVQYAVEKGKKDMLKLLIEHKANVNIGAPIVLAAEKGDVEMLDLLINAGANINQKTARGTALHVVKDLATMQFLIDKGIDVSVKNKYGQTVKRILHDVLYKTESALQYADNIDEILNNKAKLRKFEEMYEYLNTIKK